MEQSGYNYPTKLFLVPTMASKQDSLTTEEPNEFIPANIQSAFHLGCSSRMGKEEDGGVVDEEL
jgi:hypothetical protein